MGHIYALTSLIVFFSLSVCFVLAFSCPHWAEIRGITSTCHYGLWMYLVRNATISCNITHSHLAGLTGARVFLTLGVVCDVAGLSLHLVWVAKDIKQVTMYSLILYIFTGVLGASGVSMFVWHDHVLFLQSGNTSRLGWCFALSAFTSAGFILAGLAIFCHIIYVPSFKEYLADRGIELGGTAKTPHSLPTPSPHSVRHNRAMTGRQDDRDIKGLTGDSRRPRLAEPDTTSIKHVYEEIDALQNSSQYLTTAQLNTHPRVSRVDTKLTPTKIHPNHMPHEVPCYLHPKPTQSYPIEAFTSQQSGVIRPILEFRPDKTVRSVSSSVQFELQYNTYAEITEVDGQCDIDFNTPNVHRSNVITSNAGRDGTYLNPFPKTEYQLNAE